MQPRLPYTELHCLSCFSFLRGASHPAELVAQASALGYAGLAITDECSLAGVVKAHVAAKEHNLTLIIGSEFNLVEGIRLVALAPNARCLWRALGADQPGTAAQPQGRVSRHAARPHLPPQALPADLATARRRRQQPRLWPAAGTPVPRARVDRRALPARQRRDPPLPGPAGTRRQPRPAPGRLRRRADALRLAQGPARRVRRPAPST
jgi:hypothetical protein